MASEITLGYWALRGKSVLLRALLACTKLPYNNKEYTDTSQWFDKDMEDIGFEYPNLPYLIDSDKKLTEINALAQYIPIRAGRRELVGDTDDKFIQVKVAFHVAADLFSF